MQELRQAVYDEYIRHINENYEANKAAAEEMKKDLYHSGLEFEGRLLDHPLAIQKIYTPADEDMFHAVVRKMHRICCKAIREYIENPEYRKLFGFEPELEELILADPGYPDLLPIARFDIFYNEETADFKFCEINTDGTSAMNEDFELNRINIKNPAHQAALRKYDLRSFELFDTWVDEFLSMYAGFHKRVVRPSVAIVDFMDRGIVPEFYEFARRFQKRGIYAQVVDMRDLQYVDGHLQTADGIIIDAIYRRAVTADIMKEYDNVQPLIQAYKDGNVFLCGSFRTQVPHTKAFFTVLHRPESKEFLSDAEIRFVEEHIPFTSDFGPESIDLEAVIADKDRWILKPTDSYGSDSVADGRGRSQEEWEKVCRANYGKGYVIQEFATQYSTKNIDFMFGSGEFDDYINMSGLYSYNGEFAGVFTRQSNQSIIASHASERNVASYVVRGLR